MTNPIVSTYNHATGQTTEREMTDSELQAQQAKVVQRTQAQAVKATARQALLEKLGITEEEAQLLLGGV
jgi:hypothetical protein